MQERWILNLFGTSLPKMSHQIFHWLKKSHWKHRRHLHHLHPLIDCHLKSHSSLKIEMSHCPHLNWRTLKNHLAKRVVKLVAFKLFHCLHLNLILTQKLLMSDNATILQLLSTLILDSNYYQPSPFLQDLPNVLN